MKPRTPLTPAMLSTRYHERQSSARPAGEASPPQPLANYREDFDATTEWLAHIDAGRIAVR